MKIIANDKIIANKNPKLILLKDLFLNENNINKNVIKIFDIHPVFDDSRIIKKVRSKIKIYVKGLLILKLLIGIIK